jgi:hypothetical protein
MKRDPTVASAFEDPVREAVGLPIGPDACYFVGGGGYGGQDHDSSVVDYNQEPEGQPGLWCKWEPSEDDTEIQWSGAEKFYDYVEWLQYLIDHFLKRWGYVLSGEVCWQGEEREDFGKIFVEGNEITVLEGRIVYEKR